MNNKVKRTKCKYGHEYNEKNTRINKRDGSRECRACGRERYTKKERRLLVCQKGLHDLTLPENVSWDKKGRRRGCLPCHKATRERWREGNRDFARKSRYRLKYGIVLDDYERMFEKQQGLCKICHNPPKTRTLAVDHDHQTGRVRGLLCNPCNLLLGCVQDQVERLQAAIRYLNEE